MLAAGPFDPQLLANHFLAYYRQHKLVGLGASTLRAILDTEAGLPWQHTERRGHYAAGNGAAMRIAPFAFFAATTRQNLLDACRITHHNEDAYAGALAVYLAIRAATQRTWNGRNNLFHLILPDLPDTNVKDRLREISAYPARTSVAEVARLGNNGHVVNSVPFALYCATQIPHLGLATVFRQLFATGGDTDTNASIAGQVAGPLIGLAGISSAVLQQLQQLQQLQRLPEYGWLRGVIDLAKPTIG